MLPSRPAGIRTPGRPIWSPLVHGLSVSGLMLYHTDPVAFELRYIRDLEAIEDWKKEMYFGSAFQACFEGWVTGGPLPGGRQRKLKALLKDTETKEIEHYPDSKEDILFWSWMAEQYFTKLYLARYPEVNAVQKSERHVAAILTLPSGRKIKLHGYLDGEFSSLKAPKSLLNKTTGIVENKCRADWDEDTVTENIPWDLQTNVYVLLSLLDTGSIPQRVWYQHVRRPGGFSYRGPRKKESETQQDWGKRVLEHISKETTNYHFYRFCHRPTWTGLERFCWGFLYPRLEQFLDWYEWITHPKKGTPEEPLNKVHWFTPYGIYNPFEKGRPEAYRNYRLTGSTAGLVPRRNIDDPEK